jgi:hypothetical protein
MKKFKQGDIVVNKYIVETILITADQKKKATFKGVVVKSVLFKLGYYYKFWDRETFKKIKYPKGYYLTKSPIL